MRKKNSNALFLSEGEFFGVPHKPIQYESKVNTNMMQKF